MDEGRLSRARTRVRKMDKLDLANGFGIPRDGTPGNQIWTAMLAIDAACSEMGQHEGGARNCAEEAYVMLEDLLGQLPGPLRRTGMGAENVNQ